jgi:putative ABC transport system ATP-binding protein
MILPWRWSNGRWPGSLAPAVRAQGINFAYGRGDARTQVLFDISIEIPPGQFVVMTGPSGSGKTTLLTVIGGLRSMQQGQIDVLGHDLSHLSSHDLVRIRREIGFIFQMHNLFEALTATENVRMALQLGGLSSREVRLRAREMLEQFGLADRLDYKPHSLSGGQRQRVAIARALANRPRLVLADEPTAALDKDATTNVLSRLKQLTAENGTAILMVTHDHRIIELADRLVHMVDGRIVSDVVLSDALRMCEFLKGVAPFKSLTPDELTRLAEKVTRRHFDPGDVITREGDEGEELFLILEGEVEMVREDREVVRLGPTDFFGEVSLVSGVPRNATVVATEALDTYVLGKAEFRAAMQASAGFREQLRRYYFQRY